ncbi:TolC family protein [Aphanothece hegewaldii CCALA 016]|uniref:TolC family protein n=2 Tax=Aphanothece TaxID=1121 RepID=A0A2T1LSF6_9CHRO|nr:TolC family protein [Aphanothece hegewaldii CCALA 016]
MNKASAFFTDLDRKFMIFFRAFLLMSIGISINLSQLIPTLAQTDQSLPVNSNHQKTTPALDVLEPNPNPLQLPISSDEVKIQTTQPISLQQALELAERNNRELQVSRLSLERSQAALRQAKAAQFPTLGTNAELAVSADQEAPTDIDLNINDSPTSFLGGMVEVNYDLFTFGRRSARIEAAERQVQFEQLDIMRNREQIRLEVINAYYDLQEADEQVKINQAAVENAQISLLDAQALEEGGLVARFDIVRAQVQLANTEQDLVQAQAEQDISSDQLARILSLPDAVDTTAADPVQIAGQWNLSLEESLILAFKNRVELVQQLVQRNISEQQRRSALAQKKPTVSLFANYGVVGELNGRVEDGYAGGVRVGWNFFDGGAAIAGAAQEEANIKIAEVRFADTRSQIRLEVERAFKTLIANAKNIETATFALEQSKESLDMARFRFRSGIGTQLEVNIAENELTRAAGNRVRAVLNYNRALAALQRAVGNF